MAPLWRTEHAVVLLWRTGLTGGALEGAAGGRADLPPVLLDALGQFDERRVSGEPSFGPGGRKELLGTVFYVGPRLQHSSAPGGALRRGTFQVCS